MKSICLIPARGGSKRIPRKNIKMFHGKPLIAWSINCALKSQLFDNIYVSTDDEEIASISKSFGAEVPFLRPNNISDDNSIDKNVIDHFLNWCKEEKLKYRILCYLYPTAPFISRETLENCKNLLISKNVSKVFTISKFDHSPLRSLVKNKDQYLNYNWKEFANFRSQDLPCFFHDAGQCYFYDVNKLNESSMFGYELSRSMCQDIDNEEDFELAEIKFDKLIKRGWDPLKI